MANIKTTKQVQGMIIRVRNAGKKYDALVHETAIQCLMHAQEHGDVRLMDRLVGALGRSTRKNGLVFWVETFSPIRWNGDAKIGLLKEDAKTYTPFNVEDADETPFWDLAPEPPVKPFNLAELLKLIEGLDKRIDRAVDKGTFEGDEDEARELVARVQRAADSNEVVVADAGTSDDDNAEAADAVAA